MAAGRKRRGPASRSGDYSGSLFAAPQPRRNSYELLTANIVSTDEDDISDMPPGEIMNYLSNIPPHMDSQENERRDSLPSPKSNPSLETVVHSTTRKPKRNSKNAGKKSQPASGGSSASGSMHSLNQAIPDDPQALQPLLTELPIQKRWRDWWVRTLWTLIMISGFFVIVASGHLSIILMVLFIQTMVFKEVIAIAHVPSKEKKLPWFRLINWYFLLITSYFLYGETLFTHFKENVLVDAFLQPFANHHRFTSLMMYFIGFIFFVMNLKKGHYKFQFLQFFWTHMTLLVVVFQSHFIISNILEGMFWFFFPVSLVIYNDIFAYIFGFFFGKTRLIALSPKKTWEGFMGGFVCTLLFALITSRLMIYSPYFICPAKDLSTSFWNATPCQPNPVFIPVKFNFSPALMSLTKHILRRDIRFITIAPVQWHALAIACFASFIAPFGGFFASGFKRAFKLKDFGQSIPGHGGMTDRMDCQFMMGLFSYMYYTTFIKTYEPMSAASVLQMVVDGLAPKEQLELYRHLGDYLAGQHLLESP